MTTSASLSRVHLVARLCRLGAWLIAAAGLAVIVFLAVTVFYPTNQASSGLDLNRLFTTLAIALLMAIPIFFFFLILYAVGALLDYVSTEKNTQEVNDERVEIISLPKLQ